MFFIILFALIGLLFIPIPIKLSIKVENNNFSIYLYNKSIRTNRKKKKKVKKNKSSKKAKKGILYVTYKTIEKLQDNPYKPKVKFFIDFNYGFSDAALTGFSYGVFNMLSYNFYQIIYRFLKIKCFDINITPNFDEKIFYLKLTSIFYINIAQIIYIAILTKK